MIETLSPPTRKLLAITLLVLLLLSCLNLIILPFINLIGTNLERLADIRFESARLTEIKARPLPSAGDAVAPDLYIHAPAVEGARIALANRVNGDAQATNVTVELVAPMVDDLTPQRVSVELRISGPEDAMTRFLNRLEANRPLVRLTQWTLTAPDSDDGPMRLAGRATAAWSSTK